MYKRLKKLDDFGTISWLFMDGCWMYAFHAGFIFFAIITTLFVCTALVVCRGILHKHLEYVIGYIWFVTNFLWAIQDLYEIDQFLVWAKVIFWMNILLILVNWFYFGKLTISRRIKLT